MNGASAATLKRISEAFADMHQDIANEIQRTLRLEHTSFNAQSDEFACLTSTPPVTTAQRAEAYYRAALRSPHIHVSKRSDCHIIEAPKESAAELVALALQSREE